MNNRFLCKAKRLLSGVLATAMAVTMLPAIPAMAEDTELEYYLSLDANSDEYQEWKSSYVSNDSINEISTFALRSSANGISNEYIEITLNNSRYTLGTTGGNPDSSTDDNKRLLYGYPSGGTSYTTIQIDGINTVFTPESTTYRDNSIISTDVIGDVVVTQYLNIINNQYTGRDDVAEFFYTVENTSSENHIVGVRIMFDTMLGNNDSAPFRLPNVGDVTTETDLSGSMVPEFWQAFDSLTSPSVIAQGTLNIDKDSTPDRVRFTNWGMATGNPWDYSRAAGSGNGDSAVCLYWNPKSVGTGQTLSCKTYYGLSSLQQDNAPPLAVALSGATKLEVVEDENGVNSYSPNPFTVTAYIQNIGTGTAYNANIELTLPEGMSVVDGTNIVSLGDIPVSTIQKQVSWKVKVEPSAIDKIETYGIIVTADNAETKTLERQIDIPALANNGVELMLDRSVISDGGNLNLKFKIKNVSDSAIALNQICPRYYYVDESPKATKQFSCYSVQMNHPYSYISNSTVTMTKHDLEAAYDKATSYLDFAFNSDAELQPNQEIIVNASINNTSWAKIVSSNDYSAVGDDSLASNDYVLWEYMPVFSASNPSKPIWGTVPEIDTDGMEPDIMVELDPNAVNGKGYMNLNIRITNNGLLPIDLGQTEIKYYYTNDRGHDQSVAGNYIGGRIDNNYVGITDKAIVEAVKMDVRKKMADTYVSIKFAEDTGILYFEDYIDLNIQVYNTDWKSGDYILENDHSYQEEEQEMQTFSLMARASSNTTGMREAKNIVVGTRYKTSWLEDWLYSFLGCEPIKYQPTYSAFKVGEGKSEEYKLGDFNEFVDVFEDEFGGITLNEYAVGENITNTPFSFLNENMTAILESDIVYISSHGSKGGVIPVYSQGINNNRDPSQEGYISPYSLYDQIISTDKNINVNDFQELSRKKNFGELDNDNIFSINMKDHKNEDINENLQWVITAACSQLNNEETYGTDNPKTSVDRWIDVLINNTKMKGIIGYHGAAPGASNAWTPDDKVIESFLYLSAYGDDDRDSNIYLSWLNANTLWDGIHRQNAGLLVKAGYENDALYESLCDNSNVNYSSIYLYKFSTGLVIWSTIKEEYNVEHSGQYRTMAIQAVNEYLGDSSYIDDNAQVAISEITRDVYNYSGDFVENEIVDYVFTFETKSPLISTFGTEMENNINSSIRIRYNVESSSIDIME